MKDCIVKTVRERVKMQIKTYIEIGLNRIEILYCHCREYKGNKECYSLSVQYKREKGKHAACKYSQPTQ